MSQQSNYSPELKSIYEEMNRAGSENAEAFAQQNAQRLNQLGESDRQALLETLQQQGIHTNEAALLGVIGDTQAIAPLLDVLDHPAGWQTQEDADWRYACLRAVTDIALRLQNPELNPQIIRHIAPHLLRKSYDEQNLHGSADNLRRYHYTLLIVEALKQLNDLRAIPFLGQALSAKHHPDVIEATANALAATGDRAVIPYLLPLVEHPKFNVLGILEALERFGAEEVVPGLLTALNKAFNADHAAPIIVSLGRLRDNRAVAPLIRVANLYHEDHRAVTIEALGLIGDPRAIPALQLLLTDHTVLKRHDYEGALAIFLPHRGKRISELAVAALRRIGTPEALQAIAKHSNQ